MLETNPGIRPPISSYHPDIQDEVRKAYLKIRRHLLATLFILGLILVEQDVDLTRIGLICMTGLNIDDFHCNLHQTKLCIIFSIICIIVSLKNLPH